LFTGLIETIGVLRRRSGRPVARAFIEAGLGPLTLGESINVNGACLTVDRILEGGFECDLSSETLARTTLGDLPLGARVHLERATPLGGRMGGHIVLGHVDGIGTVSARESRGMGQSPASPGGAPSLTSGEAIRLEVRAPGDLERYLAPKGSVCLDGTSLTLNAVGKAGADEVAFDVMLVPHTIGRTLLGEARPGAKVNIEVDVLARYVARQLEWQRSTTAHATDAGRGEKSGADVDDERILAKLRSGGFL
jgi:riboflavin synthase